MKQKQATIKDIAKATGFSYTTVSRVLNNIGGANKENSERIKRVAEELGYQPNIVAKSLRLNSTKTIGVIVPDCSNTVYSRVIKAVEDAASENGYSIVLCNTDYDRDKEYASVRLLVEKRVDGLIMAGPLLTKKEDTRFLKSIGVPVVFIYRTDEENIMDYVITNNELGALLICDYMIGKGKKDIVFLNIQKNVPSAQQREKGFKEALEKNGVEFRPSMIFNLGKRIVQVEDGYNWLVEMLKHKNIPSAIFCASDTIATGVMIAAIENGLKVPEDIAIAGFDDLSHVEYLPVPLTTVRQKCYSIGSIGAQILLKRINNEELTPQHFIVDPELIIRKSV